METMRKNSLKNTVLIALMNSPTDFLLVQKEGWYRIPKMERTPKMVKDGTIKYIAFYHTSVFKKEKYSIKYYAKVINIKLATRRELFPNEPLNHPKAGKVYYKIQMEQLLPLVKPIISHRPRRITFIPTSEKKFFHTIQLKEPEINFLFNDSPLENLLHQKLIDNRIFPERQYFLHDKNKENNWILDFALFCKNTNINIECDGMTYHYKTEAQKLYDNQRNNDLNSKGWTVLRYPTMDLQEKMEETLSKIKTTIDKNGGVQDPKNKRSYYYVIDTDAQLRLFD